MYQSKETDVGEAQANMDAFFDNASSWVEQKANEKKGIVEKYYYNQPLDGERAALTVVWGSFVILFIGRVIYTNLHL